LTIIIITFIYFRTQRKISIFFHNFAAIYRTVVVETPVYACGTTTLYTCDEKTHVIMCMGQNVQYRNKITFV